MTKKQKKEALIRDGETRNALKYHRASLAWKRALVAECYARAELSASLSANVTLDPKLQLIERSIPILEFTIGELERTK